MHVIFIPYGKFELVEQTLNEIRAQKYVLKLISPDGKETADMWIPGQLRVLPFGFYEVVFPKESLDVVLNTLGHEGLERYTPSKTKLAMIRSLLHAEPIPEYKTDKKMLWIMNDVHIIPIGIRKDIMDTDSLLTGKYKGWSHEAI
jgi:hypothetical protein